MTAWTRHLATVVVVLAAAAFAVSLGVHPGLAAEVALIVVVVLVAGVLLRLAPSPPRQQRRTPCVQDGTSRRRVERIVTSSLESGWGVDVHLRRVVRDIAEARLAVNGVSLARDPQKAREMLPDSVADLVLPAGRRRSQTGIGVEGLAALLDDLEGM